MHEDFYWVSYLQGWGGGTGDSAGDARRPGSEEGMLALLLLLPVRQVHQLEEQISSRAVQHRQVLLCRFLSLVATLVQAASVHHTRFFNRKQNIVMGRVI